MKSMRKRLAVGLVSGLALGATTLGVLASVASADTSTGVTAVTATATDQGAQVQSGDQTATDSTLGASDEATSTDGASSEVSTASDGPGGHQDPAGNVDNQSTTES